MHIQYDDSVEYSGPQAQFATLTGSPLWGLSVNEVATTAKERGWELLNQWRPKTPYGDGPLVQHFLTPQGRSIIRIPSYGGVKGQDWKLHHSTEKVFWLLWKMKIKVLLVGGTSGIADWREDGNRIEPGDLVLPSSFRTSPSHRGLPGTEYETSWPRYDLTLDDPFCPQLAQQLAAVFEPYVQNGKLGNLHTPEDVQVALVRPDGITFETTYDIRMWHAINHLISQLWTEDPPTVTLHGDCVNPVLARLLGIHMAYYHMVANVAQGLPMKESITDTLYHLYLNNFREVALGAEFALLETMSVPTGKRCACVEGLHEAPEIFSRAMTQPA